MTNYNIAGLPGNSYKAKEKRAAPKAVTSARVRPGNPFKGAFVVDDTRSIGWDLLTEVLIPALKDMFFDIILEGTSRSLYGDSRRARPGRPGILSAANAPTNYTSYSTVKQAKSTFDRQARRNFDFDSLTIDTRDEAEAALGALADVVDSYENASVADLYEILSITPEHTDYDWGWTTLEGACVKRARGGGFALGLPRPKSLK